MPTGISIHIGLNKVDPTKYGGWDGQLFGCENDARDMSDIARQRKFSTRVLLTRQATSVAVLSAMRSAARRLKSGDILLLSYSGHGGRVTDVNGDETDGKDETWVLYDRQVIDDELYAEYARFREGVRIFVLSDSCHSGTVLRALYDELGPIEYRHNLRSSPTVRTKAMPREVQFRDDRSRAVLYRKKQEEAGAAETQELRASAILISGCQDHQLSSDGDRNGLFTETLLRVWNGGRFQGGYRKFHREIVSQMPPSQQPNLYIIGKKKREFELQAPFTIAMAKAAAR